MSNQAGYSGTPLLQKLGYKSGDQVYTIRAPRQFLDYLQDGAIILSPTLPAMWGHIFVTTQSDLQQLLDETDLDKVQTGWWFSWPKKASGVQTDLTEQVFRDFILPKGWVDTKVCAIDETWSGLKFLRRKT